ncbi:threonine--tRNA ligase [Candidatus Uhrbacteria bacterium]|nr:threonine--tRNA ligase [Candidatus Uhrbacteria bacterium]
MKTATQSLDISHLRHSLAHLLAAAVLKLYPDAMPTIGPAIENGFYYDFQFTSAVVADDIKKIETEMKSILKSWNEVSAREVSVDEAKKIFAKNPFKQELIDEIDARGESIMMYRWGDFEDLCRGGHLDSVKSIDPNAFILDKLAGAYWRGNEKNPMLTRIYGIAFATQDELESYVKMLGEAEKRDHRKLGRELDLFVFSELVGPGLALWTPRGTLVRNLLDDYVWHLRKEQGYTRVTIPHITKKELYETSGHWDKFQNDLFKIVTREGHEFAMKPMNCPHHTQIFSRKPHSYREMPQRFAETTMCYRDEQSGELHGLSRVRAFTQDDAHVFCRESQLKDEMFKIWDIINRFYAGVGFGSLQVRLSLHDPHSMEKYLGSKEVWEKTENQLRELVRERGVGSIEAPGEAAMYGPKIDFLAKDSIGREWQVATIQIDRNQPERLDLTCVNEQGEKERIVMIHAAIMGSLERFLSIFIEHCAGAFPLWLAPVQVALIPVADRHAQSCFELASKLELSGIRTHVDQLSETVGKKIRNAEKQKVPYMIVIGDKEAEMSEIPVRVRGSQDTVRYSLDAFIEHIVNKMNTQSIDL